MIKKIISGGQTGVDRAGLDAAKILKIESGGYCLKGFITENGNDLVLKKYGLIELDSDNYTIRTVKNIGISDGTVIFCKVNAKGKIISGGSLYTLLNAKKIKKPVIVNPTLRQFKVWLRKNEINILNVAGNRESKNPGIYNKVKSFLIHSLSP